MRSTVCMLTAVGLQQVQLVCRLSGDSNPVVALDAHAPAHCVRLTCVAETHPSTVTVAGVAL